MKEHRDFRMRQRKKPFTPETLMRILDQTEGGERAKEVYKKLVGKEPPEENNGKEGT